MSVLLNLLVMIRLVVSCLIRGYLPMSLIDYCVCGLFLLRDIDTRSCLLVAWFYCDENTLKLLILYYPHHWTDWSNK